MTLIKIKLNKQFSEVSQVKHLHEREKELKIELKAIGPDKKKV